MHVYPAQMIHHLRAMLKNDPIVFSSFENDVLLMRASAEAFSDGDEQRSYFEKSKNPNQILRYILTKRPSYVVFHSGFWPKSWIFMCLSILLGAKCVFLSWGGDLEPAAGLKGKLINAMRSFVIRNCFGVVFLAKGDEIAARKNYGPSRRTRVISYYFPEYLAYTTQTPPLKREPGSRVRVQVGNDASERNGHEQCFAALLALNSPSLQVVLPLGYGRFRMDYFHHLKSEAREKFGAHAELHEELLSKHDFDALLETCDAYMMASKEQRGLYNVFRHLAGGRAVFLPEDAILKRDLEAAGFRIESLDAVPALGPEAFEAICRTRNQQNIATARQTLSLEVIRREWNGLLGASSAQDSR